MSSARRDRLGFTVTVTAVAAVCALPMALLIGMSGATSTVVTATVLAAVPVGPLVAAYLWLDRYEPEPRSLLALGLAWGAFVATAAALLVGWLGAVLLPVTDSQSLAVAAPVTEEATKGAFLLLLLWWRRGEFDGILDGIVYAGMVGIGFAFVENILYLAASFDPGDGLGPGGTPSVTTTFVFRCLLSPFAHPLFTTFTGIGVGIAIGSRSRSVRVAAPLVGYLLAVVAHGTWNLATLRGVGGFLGVYVVLMVPALLVMSGFALWARSTEPRVLAAALADASRRGLFPAEDIPWLVDLRARRRARTAARAYGGADGLRAMREYQAAAIELGFLHHRYLRGTAPRDFAQRGQHFVNTLRAVRPQLQLPGQVVSSR